MSVSMIDEQFQTHAPSILHNPNPVRFVPCLTYRERLGKIQADGRSCSHGHISLWMCGGHLQGLAELSQASVLDHQRSGLSISLDSGDIRVKEDTSPALALGKKVSAIDRHPKNSPS